MSFLNKVKEYLLGQDSVKSEKDEIISATDYDELIGIIKRIKRANDVQVREVEREIDKLTSIEAEEIEKIKSGNLIERKKKLTLLAIRRIRREIAIYDKKIEIHSKNIDTHQSLIGTIEEIKSKEMLGVKEELIMKVIESAAKKDEKYQEVISTASAIEFTSAPVLTASDKAELDAIETEIMKDTHAEDTELDIKLEQEINSPEVSEELEEIEAEILNPVPKTNPKKDIAAIEKELSESPQAESEDEADDKQIELE